jgi:hypothetical protein
MRSELPRRTHPACRAEPGPAAGDGPVITRAIRPEHPVCRARRAEQQATNNKQQSRPASSQQQRARGRQMAACGPRREQGQGRAGSGQALMHGGAGWLFYRRLPIAS